MNANVRKEVWLLQWDKKQKVKLGAAQLLLSNRDLAKVIVPD